MYSFFLFFFPKINIATLAPVSFHVYLRKIDYWSKLLVKILFCFTIVMKQTKEEWMSILFSIVFHKLRAFLFQNITVGEEKMKSCKWKFMLLQLQDLNIMRKKVQMRDMLDNKESELLCQNNITNEDPGLHWCSVWPQPLFWRVPEILNSNPNFPGTHRLQFLQKIQFSINHLIKGLSYKLSREMFSLISSFPSKELILPSDLWVSIVMYLVASATLKVHLTLSALKALDHPISFWPWQ